MWSNIVFAVFLVGLSLLLLAWHVQVWRGASSRNLDERTHDFLRRQHRRRMQTSAMIGCVGLAIVAGIWVPDGLIAVAFWAIVALVVLWIVGLAFADLISARYYYGQLRKEQLAKHAELQAELERIQRHDGNGRPDEEQEGNKTP